MRNAGEGGELSSGQPVSQKAAGCGGANSILLTVHHQRRLPDVRESRPLILDSQHVKETACGGRVGERTAFDGEATSGSRRW